MITSTNMPRVAMQHARPLQGDGVWGMGLNRTPACAAVVRSREACDGPVSKLGAGLSSRIITRRTWRHLA